MWSVTNNKTTKGQKQNLNNELVGDFTRYFFFFLELSKINSECINNRRQEVPLNYSSRIKGQSVRGSRSGNRDEGVIMDALSCWAYSLTTYNSRVFLIGYIPKQIL